MRVEDFIYKLQEVRALDIATNLSHQNLDNVKDLTKQFVSTIGKSNLEVEVDDKLSEKVARIYNQYLSDKDLSNAKYKMDDLFKTKIQYH